MPHPTGTRTRSLSHTHARAHTHTRTHARARACAHARACARTVALARVATAARPARERILSACKVVRVTYSPSMRDSFPAEIVRLAPPELERLELKGASLLTRVVVSPAAALPALSRLDLGSCPALEFVQVQSDSLTHLNLSRCTGLKKALVQCRNLRSIDLEGCAALETLMLWSDELSELKLETCEELRALKLYAARLQGDEPRAQGRLVLPHGGRLRPPKGAPAPSHPPIAGMLKDLRWQAQLDAQAVEERDRGMSAPAAGVVPKPYVRSY